MAEALNVAFAYGYISAWAEDHLLIANLPGDFNHDSAVDAADYVVWRKGVGVAPTEGNYNLWRANFGSGNSAMKKGDVLLAFMQQSSVPSKVRPVLLLKRMPPYQDVLMCGVST